MLGGFRLRTMANSMFAKGREAFLRGEIAYASANIKFVFVDHADDTPVVATDDNLDDIGAAARVATSANVAGKTTTDGVADHDDTTVSAVAGDPFESIVWYEDTGTESTSQLFLYVDVATGLPFTPSGGDIQVQIDSGANRLFKL